MTKAEQCKIITDYLNASGIVNQYLNDTIMDALDEIEAKNTKSVIDRRTEAIIRNENAEEARDFLSLLGGAFSFKQKSTGEFAVIDLEDETPFTLRIDTQNHICIENYYIFHNDSDCVNTLKQICERGMKYNPNLAESYQKNLSNLTAFEEKWCDNKKEQEEENEVYDTPEF